jgi:Mg2+/Co2+ transporter CorB
MVVCLIFVRKEALTMDRDLPRGTRVFISALLNTLGTVAFFYMLLNPAGTMNTAIAAGVVAFIACMASAFVRRGLVALYGQLRLEIYQTLISLALLLPFIYIYDYTLSAVILAQCAGIGLIFASYSLFCFKKRLTR